MEERTATQIMQEQKDRESSFGAPPRAIESEEQYLKWILSEIWDKARADAEPYIRRLVEIEARKPPKPIFVNPSDADNFKSP